MSKFLFNLAIVLLFALQGQAQLNSYKYIIVPKKFEGFEKENQFRTSTQLRHLLSQNGFLAIYEDQVTPELAGDPCLGLRVLMLDNSSLLATRVRLGFRDCNGVFVYESAEGKSKTKDYELAYREAIDEAFLSVSELGYTYTPPESTTGPASVQPVSDPVMEAAGTRSADPSGEVADQAAVELAVGDPETPLSTEGTPPPVTPLDKAPEQTAPGLAGAPVGAVAALEAGGSAGGELWYAQPIENGYQLVDSTPKVRMKLLKTAQADTFIATVGDAPMGMVYKKDGQWWHEFFKDGKTEVRPLKLKF